MTTINQKRMLKLAGLLKEQAERFHCTLCGGTLTADMTKDSLCPRCVRQTDPELIEKDEIEQPCADCLAPTYGKLHICTYYCDRCGEELPRGHEDDTLCDKCKRLVDENLTEQVEESGEYVAEIEDKTTLELATEITELKETVEELKTRIEHLERKSRRGSTEIYQEGKKEMKLTIKQLKQIIKEQVEEGWSDRDSSLDNEEESSGDKRLLEMEDSCRAALEDAKIALAVVSRIEGAPGSVGPSAVRDLSILIKALEKIVGESSPYVWEVIGTR